MCKLCTEFKLDLNDREDGINASHKLTDILAEASQEHPWNFKLAPMSSEERRWFDLNHPDRSKHV